MAGVATEEEGAEGEAVGPARCPGGKMTRCASFRPNRRWSMPWFADTLLSMLYIERGFQNSTYKLAICNCTQ